MEQVRPTKWQLQEEVDVPTLPQGRARMKEFMDLPDDPQASTYLQMLAIEEDLPEDQVEEIKILAGRPKLHQNAWEASSQKFKDVGRHSEDLKFMLEMFYDPQVPAAEIAQMQELVKIKKYEKWEILQQPFAKVTGLAEKVVQFVVEQAPQVAILWGVLCLVAEILSQIAQKFFNVNPLEQVDFGKIPQIIAGLAVLAFLVKITPMMEKLTKVASAVLVQLKFSRSELLRVRFALTSGNVPQLLMRLANKLEHVERRSEKFFAKTHNFWRHLKEEVFDEDWRQVERGTDKFWQSVADFLEQKFSRGLSQITEDQLNVFAHELREACNTAIDSWRSPMREDRMEHLADIRDSIDILLPTMVNRNEAIWHA